jgi:hypothetical protein
MKQRSLLDRFLAVYPPVVPIVLLWFAGLCLMAAPVLLAIAGFAWAM